MGRRALRCFLNFIETEKGEVRIAKLMGKENPPPWDRTVLLLQENAGQGAAPKGTMSQQLKPSED